MELDVCSISRERESEEKSINDNQRTRVILWSLLDHLILSSLSCPSLEAGITGHQGAVVSMRR